MTGEAAKPDESDLNLLTGGEMRSRITLFNWSQTPLGPASCWPQSFRSAVEIMLTSRYPMLVWWGPELIQLYNDAYIPVLGQRHPTGLGQSASVCWADAWPFVGALADAVMTRGVSTWSERLEMMMTRNGFAEEVYMTFSYSPIINEAGAIGGLFCVCTEDTQRVLADRRMGALRLLADHASASKSVADAETAISAVLDQLSRDLPFTLLYRLDDEGRTAKLVGHTGLAAGTPASPHFVELDQVDDPWSFAALSSQGVQMITGELASVSKTIFPGCWPEATRTAATLALPRSDRTGLVGFLVTGLSPRLVMDEGYETFLLLLAGQAAAALGNARAYEQERIRAEALAELDRAKTIFFSNVSHEFRTPLTLMLGPLDEALTRLENLDTAGAVELIGLAHRSAQRLLKLVNTLLDFSRIEAGRADASYEATDLAAFTAELASNFRSTAERAGLALVVDAAPLPEPVFVDRTMWEKIVLNLVSNAFKFTTSGSIRVSLRAHGEHAVLRVSDTGTGIPAVEQPRVFERFRRVENALARTHEGTGIGLALVLELVVLHGGTIEVESAPGHGSTFTVRVPFGASHLPAERVATGGTALPPERDHPIAVEARHWLPDEGTARLVGLPPPRPREQSASAPRPLVLLVDDNRDMRDYVHRLLIDRYDVAVAADGESALAEIAARRPDLLLADVMMPRLDGFGLLRAIRGRPDLHGLPVILLSARAGEEARIEGLGIGADDYLVKPFSARELVARVAATLELARVRREAAASLRESEERFRALVTATSYVVYRMSADWTGMRELHGRDFLADTDGPIDAWQDKYIHPEDQERVWEAIRHAIASKSIFELEHRVRRADGSLGWILSRAVPLFDEAGNIREWFGAASDITRRKREAIEALRDSRDRLRVLEGVPQMVWRAADAGEWSWASPQWTAFTGQPEAESHGSGWLSHVHPEDRHLIRSAWAEAEVLGVFRTEHRLAHASEDRYRWVESQAMPLRNDAGRVVEWLGTTTDVEEMRRGHEEQILIAELQHRTRNLLSVVSGIADRTIAASASLEDFALRFEQRLAAVGRVQGLLSRKVAPNVTVEELLRLELAAHGVDPEDASALLFTGPAVVLPPRTVQLLALALHELLTNALKHGALGQPDGRLCISWQSEDVTDAVGPRCLRVDWVETGAAAPSNPDRHGFGRDLIETILPYELDAETDFAVTANGVRCRIVLPLHDGFAEPLRHDAAPGADARDCPTTGMCP